MFVLCLCTSSFLVKYYANIFDSIPNLKSYKGSSHHFLIWMGMVIHLILNYLSLEVSCHYLRWINWLYQYYFHTIIIISIPTTYLANFGFDASHFQTQNLTRPPRILGKNRYIAANYTNVIHGLSVIHYLESLEVK